MQATHAASPKASSTPDETPRADFYWLLRFINVHRRAAILSIVTGMFAGIFTALQPYLIGRVIDDIRAGTTVDQLLVDVLLVIGLALVIVVFFFGQRYYSGLVAYSVNYDVRRTLYQRMLAFDQDFYQRHPTGDLISRMHSDVEMIWRLLAIAFTRGGSAVFTLIAALILLGAINPLLTLVVFVILSISTTIQMRAGKVITPLFERVQDQAGRMSALVQDTVTGIQTIKTFGREAEASRKFAEENQTYRRKWLYYKRRYEPVGMLPNAISETTTGVVILFGGFMTLSGAMTLGNFVQFLLYLGYISQVLLQIGTIYQRWQQTRGALVRLTPLLAEPGITDEPSAHALPAPRGEIRFEDVGLKLGDNWLLRHVNLTIQAGETVAVVGPTGCGKTLLVNLLARVFDVNEGRVLVDGIDVRRLKLTDLRRAIAYVPQSTFLFSQALHRHVRMAHLELDDESLMRAVHISRLSNDLPQLPQGLETLVGERGVMLSGGQKQRVAIARAIVHSPAILVLDDALSSVDTQTAADILSDLRHVLKARTSVIIAHRIATIKDADRIILMDHGRVVAEGTHEALIASNEVYARMVERELKHEEEGATNE